MSKRASRSKRTDDADFSDSEEDVDVVRISKKKVSKKGEGYNWYAIGFLFLMGIPAVLTVGMGVSWRNLFHRRGASANLP